MDKVLKALPIIACVFVVFLIGRCFYMVASISSTIPHIRDYEFVGTVKQFENGVKKLCADNKDINFEVTDIYSGSRRAFDIKIYSLVDTIQYQVNCDSIGENKSELQMIGAFARTPKSFYGGYGIKADGMNKLLSKFENDFLRRLNKSQHITLKPKE